MSNKSRNPAAPLSAAVSAGIGADLKAALADAAGPVTPENIAQVLAEAPKPKRSDTLKQPTEAWADNTVAHRLRQSINFLHAYGFLPDSEAIRLKEEVDEQERT